MSWHTHPARSRCIQPTGFIVPCQPTLVSTPPAGFGWVHEIKQDGYRLIARKEGNRVRLWSRHGVDFTAKLTRIAKAVGALPAENALLDGEAVVLLDDGQSDFEALKTTAGAARATLVAFDLLHIDDCDLRGEPLEGRRAALQGLVDGAENILFSEALTLEGALVFEGACRLGLEGIVSKRLGRSYRSGRSKDWVKTKDPAFQRRWRPRSWETLSLRTETGERTMRYINHAVPNLSGIPTLASTL